MSESPRIHPAARRIPPRALTTPRDLGGPAPGRSGRRQPDLVLWAASEAGRLLADLPDRWRHTQETAVHAWWASVGLPRPEQQLLVAAAYLHDIGYAPEVVDSGFHPLDGARYLLRQGHPELAALVAHHSGAAVEARHRGLAAELAQFALPGGAVADALTYSDITTGPRGETVEPGPRLREIVRRHGAGSIVARSRLEARVDLFAAVVRTLRRVARSRPAPAPLAASTVDLACAKLVRLDGRMTSAEGVETAHEALERAVEDRPHSVVCDLALLESLSPEGAAELASATERTGLPVVLLEPRAGVSALLRDDDGDAGRAAVVTDVREALTAVCGCR
ncbi:HD superfamily phosphodiesterase [Kineococcus xinjiangensis]|uniref:HD superfamily phosphodiesterase n=1 Tax=Kineococcus xinjiangensis TaxID=512762 RepID=A0A2S6ISH2_9ACTN|nr:HD domain-containing protein [Kineococcus xinjiangensis]PPK97204.1 HD superfamily phosphodiesterase [Kineococcus xinjiangensis]